MNIVNDLFQESKDLQKVALFAGDETITYPALYALSARVSFQFPCIIL